MKNKMIKKAVINKPILVIVKDDADQRLIDNREEMMDMLEKLLAITESLKHEMDRSDREEWSAISARTADIRDGEDV
jgi:hypothetical protein